MTVPFSPRRLGALGLGLFLAGCAAGPDFVRPPLPDVAQYDAGPAPAQVSEAVDLNADWWTQFHSDKLDQLVTAALADNPGLAGAEAALRASEADRRAGAGIFYPSVALGYSAQRERSTPARLGAGGVGSVFNVYTLGATIAYSVDLFGANRRLVEGLSAQVDEARYQRDAARLALAGNVVNAAIAYAAYREQANAAQRIVDAEREQLALIDANFRAGISPESALLAVNMQLQGSIANLAPIQARADASRHLLASLLGKAPSGSSLPLPEWGELQQPGTLPLTLPSTLVRQRPDILITEARLHAATAALGVATADLYPSLTLDASGGWASNRAHDLGKEPGKNWLIGPSLTYPLFTGGALTAHRDSTRATVDAAYADYRQSVLKAFDEVADVLSNVEHDGALRDARTAASAAAVRTVALAEATRQTGVIAEADYLTLVIQREAARMNAIDADALQLQNAVALYVALGGGLRPASQEPRP